MQSRFFEYKYWLDWLYPNRCPICNKIINWDKLICEKCESDLIFLKNMDVRKPGYNTDFTCAVFSYTGNVLDGIYKLKNNKGVNLAEYASNYLADFLKKQNIHNEIDLITCVPMAKKKKLYRGYNQAEIIAGFLSKKLKKPVNYKLIKRKNSKIEQHKLNSKQRYDNAIITYFPHPDHKDVTGKNILICDDVITTGATINRCAEILKSMGANRIYAAAICTTVPRLKEI